ncbi:MAG: hypothetical protein IT342_24030 [Candidatus Melainabacteria bacterium]|nr:hypothetical protein [Candidatus Melainabacteria bacterium]
MTTEQAQRKSQEFRCRGEAAKPQRLAIFFVCQNAFSAQCSESTTGADASKITYSEILKNFAVGVKEKKPPSQT